MKIKQPSIYESSPMSAYVRNKFVRVFSCEATLGKTQNVTNSLTNSHL